MTHQAGKVPPGILAVKRTYEDGQEIPQVSQMAWKVLRFEAWYSPVSAPPRRSSPHDVDALWDPRHADEVIELCRLVALSGRCRLAA